MADVKAVRLQLLGAGDAFGNGGRFQTCFWLSGPDDGLLIDCGATSLTALKSTAIEPNDIDRSCSPTCTATTTADSRFSSSTASSDAESDR